MLFFKGLQLGALIAEMMALVVVLDVINQIFF